MIHNIEKIKDLNQIRRRLGMSQAALARRSGVSLPTVVRVLGGDHAAASFATVTAIARALGIELALDIPTQIEKVRERQARAKAERLIRMSQATAGLEGAGVDAPTLEDAIRRATVELLAGPNLRLWSD